MFQAAVGHGIDPDSEGAIQEALEQCKQTLGNVVPQAGILFAAIDFDHEVIIHQIRQIYPDLLLIGGTSAGEMSSAMGFQEDSVTLMLFCSDEVTFRVGVGTQASEDAIAAAKTAIAQASPTVDDKPDSTQPIKLCYVLSDGLRVDGAAVAEGLREAINQQTIDEKNSGQQIPIIGGMTCDDWQFKNCYQFINTPEQSTILQGAVVVLTFAGNLKVSHSITSGRRLIGPKAIVTKSEGYTIYEIDGQPPQEFYMKTLGISDATLVGGSWAGGIAVHDDNSDNFYVRLIKQNDADNGQISYFGQIPEGSTIQLVETDNNTLLTTAQDALQTAVADYPGNVAAAALIVSCASRLKSLGTRIPQEFELVGECLGNEVGTIGFYSFGEMSHFAGQTIPYFHNETFVVTLLGT